MINARDICQQTPLNVGVDNNGCTTWDVKEQIDYVDFNFAFDSDVVPEDAKSDLAQLAQKVISNDDFHITIIGDTSPEGSLAYNEKLAHRRANSVLGFLLDNGVAIDKIDVHYFTEDIPIVSDFMTRRQHRVVTLMHSPDYELIPQWDIFMLENELKNREGRK